MTPPAIAVVDYDMGNLHSVCKGLETVGARPLITADPQVLADAAGVVLPGVGAFDPAMIHLRERRLVEPLREIALGGKPFLGVCLGLQILFSSSEEGEEPGLDIIPGVVRRFRSEPGLTIPHMGWNTLTLTQPDLPLWRNLPPQPQVYFVHSYYGAPEDPQVQSAVVTHGTQTVTAAIAQGALMATQFHPEKSANLGLQILANFVALTQAEKSPPKEPVFRYPK
ncbi:MAG: imidazole glycerol phosphate synthase subunit HisH [Cyanobacteria bacterium RI_101]|nr:imidazole glycerol phosphate synthase subunit HisH [Cyanobacteria bacterium RI_101]